MKTAVISEPTAFVLQGGSWWSTESEKVVVTWKDLRASGVGSYWEALNPSNVFRAEYNESATVVFKDEHGCKVLHRRWGTSDSPNPINWEEEEIVWYEFLTN